MLFSLKCFLGICQNQFSVTKLNKSIYPLRIDESEAFDFIANKIAIAQKEIVSIGEVTHGTKEAIFVQSKLCKKLCVRYGYNIIVLGELFSISTLPLNDYLVYGKGSYSDAIEYLHASHPLITEELIDLIKFVYDVNQTRTIDNRIWIVGTETSPPYLLASTLLKLDRNIESPLLFKISHMTPYLFSKSFTKKDVPQLSEEFKNALLKSRFSDKNGINLLWEKHLVDQFYISLKVHIEGDDYQREIGIFENIKWLKENIENSKIVIILAHNAHIEKVRCNDYFNVKRFGHFLQEKYPTQYYSICTEVESGYYTSGLNNHRSEIINEKGKIGQLLGLCFKDNFAFVDLSNTDSSSFFRKENNKITYGAFNNSRSSTVNCKNITKAFDGLIFIRVSNPSNFLKFSSVRNSFMVYIKIPDSLSLHLNNELSFLVKISGIRFISDNQRSVNLRLQVYTHDKNKRLLNFDIFKIYENNDSHYIKIPTFPKAKFYSLTIIGDNLSEFSIESLSIDKTLIDSTSFILIEDDSFKKYVKSSMSNQVLKLTEQ